MYTACNDLLNSPLRTSTGSSLSFSNVTFLLNSIPESIVIISEKGLILELNSATSRLFGWTKDEIINRKNISFLLTNRDGEKLMNIINNEELSSYVESCFHYHGLNKNGSTFPCDISLGLFPKSLLETSSVSSSLSIKMYSNNAIVVVINTNKKVYRSSDSVLLDLKSRYQNEYEEIKTLGKGGFGQVYKARNRLDGQLYAIKKIKLQSKPKEFSSNFDLQGIVNPKSFNSQNTTSTTTSNLSFLSEEDLRIVREVKTFARISNHPNIVRYHASWIEVEEKRSKKDKNNSNGDDDSLDSSCDEDDEIDESYNNIEKNLENSYSYSNNSSVSNNVNFHSHGSSLSDESRQQTSNDFIISFVDTQNRNNTNINNDSNNNISERINNSSNEYFINMNDLDSLHSNDSKSSGSDESDESDDSTNINSSKENSYTPFSFISNEDNSKSYEHIRLNSLQIQKNRKKKLSLDPINTSVIKPQEKKNNLMLYLIIQMELCSGQTLETWIHERNKLTEKKEIHVDRKVIFKIFKQIVQAIAHVHWNGCIHRDVKPANVFLQDDNHILLGDFGLAKDVDLNVNSPKTETIPFSTTLVDNEDEYELSSEILKELKDNETEITSAQVSKFHKLTSGVGTYIYASPEQLASSQGYDNKTDIYSLGILLFELLWPFKTGMERIKTLTNIRDGKFPDNFVEKWPLELPFLKSLLNPDPALRPTAQEILDSEVLNINYITPLYSNPTNLLNALDLRVTRISLDPNESLVITGRGKSKERKGHNKTLSTTSKIIKNYSDCGACKQKDLAINSFKSQFVKTKDTIIKLEDSVAKASRRVWVVSIITFFIGSILTLGITSFITNRNSGSLFDTSSIRSTDIPINMKASLHSSLDINDKYNLAHASEIQEIPVINEVPVIQEIQDDHAQIDKSNFISKKSKFNKEKIEINDEKLNKRLGKENSYKSNNNKVKSKDFTVTQTFSINYFYQSKTITVTRTKTRVITYSTSTQSDISIPTI
ncbi:kinase-like protein [Piromyces finnis]|uniref:non-specific serine/threonine protein kinase n=1 Tax=Piromyces finnis TaxID=1754191 RepID=A0A1Y1VGZ8_9FUNG|nr:kinase-like protein [Piromyces finnis]|eukprot:ORX55979.1 kinase-like protein [Piromyces finnis]